MTRSRTHSTLCPGTQSSDNFCLDRQKYSPYVRGCVDAAIIGESVATLVAGFVVLFCYLRFIENKEYGTVRTLLILVPICTITYFIAFSAYVIMLTDPTLAFDNGRAVLENLSIVGGVFFLAERLSGRS